MGTELIRLHYGSDGRLRHGNDAINAHPVGPPKTLEWEDGMTTLEHLILIHKPTAADSYVKAEETFTYKVIDNCVAYSSSANAIVNNCAFAMAFGAIIYSENCAQFSLSRLT